MPEELPVQDSPDDEQGDDGDALATTGPNVIDYLGAITELYKAETERIAAIGEHVIGCGVGILQRPPVETPRRSPTTIPARSTRRFNRSQSRQSTPGGSGFARLSARGDGSAGSCSGWRRRATTDDPRPRDARTP